MTKSFSLKYEKEMQEFLSIYKWDDVELKVDTEIEQVSLSTNITISGQNGKGIIEANSDNDIFDFYIYMLALKCKAKKIDQMKILLTEIHNRWAFGRFEYFMLDDFLHVRWRLRFDFEGCTVSGLTIKNNFQAGWDAAERFIDTLMAVALTNQSAEEAIAEYEVERERQREVYEAAQKETDDGPSEL
jgi:hypothetical protein